jgi:hypothetical protein
MDAHLRPVSDQERRLIRRPDESGAPDRTRPTPTVDAQAVEAFAQTLATLGLDAERLVADERGTLTHSVDEGPTLVATLPCLSGESGRADEVRLQTLLGEGGMGQVFAAEQVSLQREVAVKRVRPGGTGREALLREALVTGRLEHPGIVPVHILGQTPDGAPLFVMKRVEGITWRDALAAPEAVERLCGSASPQAVLDFHLDVLARVASAVAFAHARGVLHRDLKPENVMLGGFGEVYVMDWGLAVALRADAVLPQAAAERAVVGTPSYMAPEMAVGNGAALSERSDVFLLGAMLYHVLAWRPPYHGATLLSTLTEAHLCTPAPLPEGTSEALSRLCRHAMARDPQDRPESVEAFREALMDCRRHAGSSALSQATDARNERLVALVPRAVEGGTEADVHTARVLYAECRFGYQQALSAWPENTAARAGLTRAVEAMLEIELARRNLDAASLLLLDLPQPPDPAFVARVDALRAARDEAERRTQALERLADDHDLNAEAAWRARVTRVVALVWSGLSVLVAWAHHSERLIVTPRVATAFITVYSLMMLGVQWLMVRRARANLVMRRMMLAATLGNGFMVLHWAVAWALDVPLIPAHALYMLWVGCGWCLVGAALDRQLIVTGLAFALGGLATVAFPVLAIEFFGLAVLFGLLHAVRVWGRIGDEIART